MDGEGMIRGCLTNFYPPETTLTIILVTHIQHVDIKEIKILNDKKSYIYTKWAFWNVDVKIQVQLVPKAWRQRLQK